MVHGLEDSSLSPRHHDHDGRDLEAEPHDPERMRLMIQITVFLNILKTCFLRLKELWSSQWANQPSRTPGNRSPSGWRTEGIVRLVKGMPNVLPTWSEGWTDSGEEPNATPTTSGWMKRCSGRLRLDQSPRPRKTAIEALTLRGVMILLQPILA